MNTQDHNQDDYRLIRQLQREARRSRPVFSESLHARILTAVRAVSLPHAAVDGRRPSEFRRPLISWTVAATASIALAAALAFLLNDLRPATSDAVVIMQTPGVGGFGQNADSVPSQSVPPGSGSEDLDATAEEVARSAADISDWVVSAASENQWAGLDRDAQAALAAVAAPLPFDLGLSLAADAP